MTHAHYEGVNGDLRRATYRSLPPDVGVSHSLCDGSVTLSCGVVQSMCDSVNRDGGASVRSTSSVENETTVTFTAEQERRFQIRYEEGF